MFYKSFKDNLYFIIPFIFLLIVVFPFFIIYPKDELHLLLNQINHPAADWFFKHITFVGDGIFVIICIFIFLFISFRFSAFFLASYLVSGIITQILKRIVFPNVLRPSAWFGDSSILHTVEGVSLKGSLSFPSGHATTAFAFFLCMAMITANKSLKVIYFVSACIVAYSRVYLSQHFLNDVYVGAIIGSITSFVFFHLFFESEKKWHNLSINSLITNDNRKA